MGDFNTDMPKHEKRKNSAIFLDSMYPKFLLLYMTAPSRIISRSQLLTDNTFSSSIDNEISKCNITSTVFDHYAQFFLTEKYYSKK